jgi:agmatinase
MLAMGEKRRLGPVDALKSPRFAGVTTFARLPHTKDLQDVDVAFVGIPFDDATTFRSGARFGPKAVREASLLIRPYNPSLKVAPFEVLNVIDYGDVDVVPGYIEDTYVRIQGEIGTLARSHVLPLICGGDHSVTLPVLRALRALHGKLSLVHVDAHADCWDEYFGRKYNHGTVFRRALDEGLVDPRSSVHVGIRGPVYSERDYQEVREMGYELISMDEIRERGLAWAVERVRKTVRGPAYVSFDIDACDPSVAPGTGTPEVGGLLSHEAQLLVRSLAGVPIVGFDLVEVSPPYDHGAITALLAANILYEALSLVALNARAGLRSAIGLSAKP